MKEIFMYLHLRLEFFNSRDDDTSCYLDESHIMALGKNYAYVVEDLHPYTKYTAHFMPNPDLESIFPPGSYQYYHSYYYECPSPGVAYKIANELNNLAKHKTIIFDSPEKMMFWIADMAKAYRAEELQEKKLANIFASQKSGINNTNTIVSSTYGLFNFPVQQKELQSEVVNKVKSLVPAK